MGWGKKTGGKQKGYKAPHTLEAQEVKKKFVERVHNHADDLFNAQLSTALGSTYVYRIERTKVDNKTKEEHILVTDPEEIKMFLDEHEGSSGSIDGEYYYITTKAPDNVAINSLLNRAMGTPTQTIETTQTKKYSLDDPEVKKIADDLVKLQKNGTRENTTSP